MLNSNKEFLLLFGWDDFFESQISNLVSSSLFPARIICEERNLYRVQAGLNDVFWASLSGKQQFNASLRVDYPTVGDWVLVDRPDQSERGMIHQLLARKTTVHRRQVGSSGDMQILSTNIDYVFVTTSVNEDLNFRRIDRYLAVARDAGCVPVILLTKADKCMKPIAEVIADVEKEFPGVAVHALSQSEFSKTDVLAKYLQQGKTSVFIGSSGVGKSTLVNYLTGSDQSKTQEIRENDSKGRHTTTSRQLYISNYGGLIIDTPGMRELQLSDHAEGLSEQFADIEELMTKCRFGNCKHQTEPGCAILAAIADESLSAARWKSYQKLEAEIRSGLVRKDKILAAEDKRTWKKLNIAARARSNAKKGDFNE
jgi:ribosome biogenesis GTPase